MSRAVAFWLQWRMLIGAGDFCGLSSVSDNEIEAGRQAGGGSCQKSDV